MNPTRTFAAGLHARGSARALSIAVGLAPSLGASNELTKRLARIAIAVVAIAAGSCSPETKPNSQVAQDYARLCSVQGMLDEVNRAKWIELAAAIDRGDIRREQVSLAPQMPSFSSGDRSSLEARVEASVGDVAPVAGSNSDDDGALFQGPLVVLLDGERLLQFRNFYLATDTGSRPGLYGLDMQLRSCFSERGTKYLSYIGRQK
jgi:hypothetical protein